MNEVLNDSLTSSDQNIYLSFINLNVLVLNYGGYIIFGPSKLTMSNKEQPFVIRFLFLEGHNNHEIHQRLVAVYGDDALSLRTVQDWTKKFRDGRTDAERIPSPGRPHTDGLSTAIQEQLDINQFCSAKKLGKILGHHTSTITSCLREQMGLMRVNFRWIPYSLNESQKRKRVEMAAELLEFLRPKSASQLKHVITGDETWVYLSNPRNALWHDTNMPRPERPRQTIGAKKVMITVLWSVAGFRVIEALPTGRSFNKDYFESTILASLEQEYARTRPVRKTNGIFIHLDNARPHLVAAKLQEMGIERLQHPPYSPDLAPSDFYLFGYLKNSLEGTEARSEAHLLEIVTTILRSIPVSTLKNVYGEWMDRLQRCIDTGGEYVH